MSNANNIAFQVSLDGVSRVENGLRRVGDLLHGLAQIRNVVPGLAAVTASILSVHKAMEAIGKADEFGKLAQRVGTSVEEFSKLAAVARLADVDLGSLQQASKNMLEWMLKNGQGGRNLTDVLVEQADAFAGMADGAQKAALAAKLFGDRAGLEMIPLLNQGSAALREQMQEMQRLGLVTAEDAAISEEFNDTLTKWNLATESLTRSMTIAFLPSLTRAVQVITNLTASANEAVRVFPSVRIGLEAVAAAAVTAGVAMTLSKVGGFAGMEAGFSKVAKSVALVGAAFTGWKIGEALGQMELFGITLNNRVQASILGTQLAWEKLKVSLGAGNLAFVRELEAELAQLVFKVAQVVPASVRNPVKKPLAADEEDEATRVKRLQDELKVERELLDVKIAEQEYFIAKNRQQSEQRGFVTEGDLISIRAANAEIEKLIQQKRELSTTGKFGAEGIKPFLNDSQFQSLETKDRTDLLATDKTASQSRFTDTGVLDQIRAASEQMQREFGTVAQSIARTFKDVIGGAVSAVSDGISSLIKGTATWGQALQSVGVAMVNTVIESFARMAAEWVVTHVLMQGVSWAFKGVMSLIRGTETAEEAAHAGARLAIHSETEAGMTAASGFGALARGASRVAETIHHGVQLAIRKIAFVGAEIFMTGVHLVQTGIRLAAFIAAEVLMTTVHLVQSGIRVVSILAEAVVWLILAAIQAMAAMASIPYVGPILAIVAMAAIIAAGVGVMSGFAEGGFVSGEGSGTSDSINARLSNGEYVVNAAAVSQIGVPTMDAINEGQLPVAERPVGVPLGGESRPVSINVFVDKAQLRNEILTSPDFDKHVVDAFARNRRRFNV